MRAKYAKIGTFPTQETSTPDEYRRVRDLIEAKVKSIIGAVVILIDSLTQVGGSSARGYSLPVGDTSRLRGWL